MTTHRVINGFKNNIFPMLGRLERASRSNLVPTINLSRSVHCILSHGHNIYDQNDDPDLCSIYANLCTLLNSERREKIIPHYSFTIMVFCYVINRKNREELLQFLYTIIPQSLFIIELSCS